MRGRERCSACGSDAVRAGNAGSGWFLEDRHAGRGHRLTPGIALVSPIHPLVEGRQESRGAAGLGCRFEGVGQTDQAALAPGTAEEREADR